MSLSEEAHKLREESGGFWRSHPDYPVTDWQYEVANNDTRLGYWEWVVSTKEMEVDDE